MPTLLHVATFALLAPLALQGQSAVANHTVPPPVAQAVRRTHEIRVDGTLDDPDWTSAPAITAFVQTQPTEGAPATQRTEIRVLFDDEALYIGARMYDSLGASGVRARLARRDALLGLNGSSSSLTSDKLTITLDAYHDHLGQAMFQINPYGVIGDALGEGGSGVDASWDPVWEAAVRTDSLGWTAELRIPLSQLGYRVTDDRTWGMHVERVIDRLNEHDVWSFWRSNEQGGPARFGHLSGLDVPPRRRGVEAMPYVVTRTRRAPVDAGNPFVRHTDETFRAGADMKAQVTPTLTLNATINPDFGQVEADPAVVNLSAFETFFPEKRPFFVQGSNAFDFGGFSCFFCHNVSSLDAFYSRRIGRAPQLGGYVSGNARFADVPDASAILGAAKLTGRIGSNTVGILDAVTNAESARLMDTVGGPRHTQLVEPATNYLVARGRRDFRGGATTVGAIATSVLRSMDDSLVASQLRRSATAGGIDFSTATTDRMYTLMGSMLLSDVTGTPAAILRTQQSSAHYFQRPDRREHGDGLFGARYDSSATSLRGYGAYLRGAKENGNWLWEGMVNARSPGFEVNDVSDLSRADYMWTNVNVARQWTVPGRWYRNLWLVAGNQEQYNYDGDHTLSELHADFSVQFLNYWFMNGFYLHDPPALDDQLTRGGPVVVGSGVETYRIAAGTDSRKPIVFSTGFRYSVGTGNGRGTARYSLAPELLVKPTSYVSIDVAPSLSGGTTAQQFVTTTVDPTATAFAGRRVVFATIQQTTLSLDTRVAWTFTPRLTLETYVQPFLASGAYSRFHEFARTRDARALVYGRDGGSTIAPTLDASRAVTGYTVDPDGSGSAPGFTFVNPDFNTRSLMGNAVLRWEYRPGSTLYLVWTHQREDDVLLGRFGLSRDFGTLFRAQPTNTVQLKISYWLGR